MVEKYEPLKARAFRAMLEIRRHRDVNGPPPSYLELGDAVGLDSTGAVSNLIKSLEKKGYVCRVPGSSRTLTNDHVDIGKIPLDFDPSIEFAGDAPMRVDPEE